MSGQPYFALEYRYIVINIAFVILYVIINQWYYFLNFVLIIKVKNRKRDIHNVSLRSTKGLFIFYFCSFIMGSCDLGLSFNVYMDCPHQGKLYRGEILAYVL